METPRSNSEATSSPSRPDRPPIRHCERSSPVKNRMLEIGTSGSVRGGDGNIPTYSAPHHCARNTDDGRRAGVRKPPGKETAGEWGSPVSGRYGDFGCSGRAARVWAKGARADSGGETAPRRRVE